jgi:hypothetical protein
MIGPDEPDYSFMQHILQEAIHYFPQKIIHFSIILIYRCILMAEQAATSAASPLF